MSFFMLRPSTPAALFSALFSVLFFLTTTSSVTAAVSSNEVIDPAMQELFAVLEEKTEIATHTKINIDFVPGMVSVLHAKDLLARGVRTVTEALTYVPGIELSSNNTGQILVLVRGVGRILGSSKIKILLDGIALNSTLQAASLPMMLPLQLVDRIEMIRGPGSAIYGEFASVGVLNIITRKNEKYFFNSISTASRKILGGLYNSGTDHTAFNMRFSRDWNKGGRVLAGSDILKNVPFQGFRDVSNAPGLINDAGQRSYLSLSSKVDNFQVNWQWLEHASGDYFGAANALPSNSNKLLRKVVSQNINFKQDIPVNKAVSIDYNFGWLRSVLRSRQHEVFPSNSPKLQPDPNPSDGFDKNRFVDGVLGGPHYEEDKYYIQSEINIVTELNHDLLIGAELSQVNQGKTFAFRNYQFLDETDDNIDNPTFGEIPNQHYTGSQNWLREGLSRQLIALYVQDQYALTDSLHLTTGIRYDHYDDIGSDVTPRIASVYQFDQYKTFKVQFAQSFRPPVFIEMYSQNNPVVNGNPDLRSERMNTIEVSYAYNKSKTIARANLYHYKLRDLIVNDPLTSKYTNKDEVTADGIELELQRDISRSIKFEYTFSYVNARNQDNSDLPNIANVLSSVGVFYTPLPDWSTSLRVKYSSSRRREAGDPREALSSNNIVDISLLIEDFVFKDMLLSLAGYNIFNTAIEHPALRTSFRQDDVFTYENDYPQLGRELALSLQYSFR